LRALTLAVAAGAALMLAPWLRVLPAIEAHIPPIRVVLLPRPPILHPHILLCLLTAIAVGWLVLTAVELGRVVARLACVRRFARAAQPASDELARRARRLAPQLRRLPRVVISEGGGIPFVTGILDSTIVLPRDLVESLDAGALDLVLRHEIAHVVRHDVLW